MNSSAKHYAALLSFMVLLLSGTVFAQEQWQLDQAVGKYWHVNNAKLFSYSPEENNPGLMMVMVEENGEVHITISAELELGMFAESKVRYSFNRDIQMADPSSEQWQTLNFFGATSVIASQNFIRQFMRWAKADGFVDVEMTDKNGDAALRRFIFKGFPSAYNELAAELGIAQIGTMAPNGDQARPIDVSNSAEKQNMFEGWQIEKGRITKVTSIDGQEIEVVVAAKDEGTEIRFYPDAEFTRNGETRVRAGSNKKEIECAEFSVWSTVLEEGRSGYLVTPTAESDTLQNPSVKWYKIELIDRNDEHVVRTFEVANLLLAFDEMRKRYPELAIGSKNSQYYVRFNLLGSDSPPLAA